MFLLNLSQRSELANAGVGEENVEFALLLADGLVNLVDKPEFSGLMIQHLRNGFSILEHC